MLSSTGHSTPDVRVDLLWPSIEVGERKLITVKTSTFLAIIDGNMDTLRRTSILYVCSAFETALCNYFSLCALYKPRDVTPSSSYTAMPSVLGAHPNEFAQLKTWAIKMAGQRLKGLYSARIGYIATTFGLTKPSVSASIDGWYEKRHVVAHDQGLGHADAPDLSAHEALLSRISLNEPTWKNMLADFWKAILALDSAVQSNVVTDRGLQLAVYRALSRANPPKTLSQLKADLIREWKIQAPNQEIIAALRTMGRQIGRMLVGGDVEIR